MHTTSHSIAEEFIINPQLNIPGHLFRGTHWFFCSLMTCPAGHSHLATHCLVQIGLGVVQFAGHAEPHSLNICPLAGQEGGGLVVS